MSTPDNSDQTQAQARARLTEQARGLLLAEALGDLHNIAKAVAEVKGGLADMRSQQVQNKHWCDQLDIKIAELNALRVAELASAPLQQYAERFMRALGADIKRVVDAEAKDTLAHYIRGERRKVTMAAVAVAFFAGLFIGQMI